MIVLENNNMDENIVYWPNSNRPAAHYGLGWARSFGPFDLFFILNLLNDYIINYNY